MQKKKVYVAEINERPFRENYSQAFRKTPEDRSKLEALKKENVQARREEFGAGYNNHLNTTENSRPTQVKRY